MSHRDQFIWQRGIKLAKSCYELTRHFPKDELYGMTSQIRRCSVSVPSNIAEGYGRLGEKEYKRYLSIALGSLRELDTQLVIALEVQLASSDLIIPVGKETNELIRIMVSTLRKM